MNNPAAPRIEILAVGAELLSPYYLDTNSLYLTRHLNRLGMAVTFKTVVGDNEQDLSACLDAAGARSDLIFLMGGLGPTRDDRTREVFASILGRKLIFQSRLWQQIRQRFLQRGIPLSEINRKQAFIPEGAEALENRNGTAPGIWLEAEGRIWVLLPGPPRELEPMFLKQVFPRLTPLRQGYQVRTILKITGLTESQTEAEIADLYPRMEPDVTCTVLAIPGQIEIHLSAVSGQSESEAQKKLQAPAALLRERLGIFVFTSGEENLEEVVGRLLLERQTTLAVAESCTGGLLGHRITNVPGSSRYFLEGVQVYSNQAKSRLLGIPESLLIKKGAVSAEVAARMAQNVRRNAGSDYGLAVTGIAGPGGGSEEKPVGLVYVALAHRGGVKTEKNRFLGDRDTVKRRGSQKALDMLRIQLLDGIPADPEGSSED